MVASEQDRGALPRPYLVGGEPEESHLRPLADVERAGDGEAAEADHREALELALASADADASAGDHRGALRWLELAEELNVTVPAEYTEKRRLWRGEVDGDARS